MSTVLLLSWTIWMPFNMWGLSFKIIGNFQFWLYYYNSMKNTESLNIYFCWNNTTKQAMTTPFIFTSYSTLNTCRWSLNKLQNKYIWPPPLVALSTHLILLICFPSLLSSLIQVFYFRQRLISLTPLHPVLYFFSTLYPFYNQVKR